MYGINNNKISGNARIVAKLPLLAINITAKEEDLLNHSTGPDGFVRFYLYERPFPDDFNNNFVLFNGIWKRQKEEIAGAALQERVPSTVISIVLHSSFLLDKDFQRVKSQNDFIKMHLVESEDSELGEFDINPGHYNYIHKHKRTS